MQLRTLGRHVLPLSVFRSSSQLTRTSSLTLHFLTYRSQQRSVSSVSPSPISSSFGNSRERQLRTSENCWVPGGRGNRRFFARHHTPSEIKQAEKKQAEKGVCMFSRVESLTDFQRLSMQDKPVLFYCISESCQELPTLTAQVVKMKGHIVMATVDMDQFPDLQAALSVSETPAVVAVHDNRVLGSFEGAQNAAYVEQFVSNVFGHVINASVREEADQEFLGTERSIEESEEPDKEDVLLEGYDFLRNKQYVEASQNFCAILDNEECTRMQLARATAGLVRIGLLEGNPEEAQELVQTLIKEYTEEDKEHPDIMRAIIECELLHDAAAIQDISVGELKDSLADLPPSKDKSDECSILHSLAVKLFLLEEHDEAVNLALLSVRLDKKWNNEASKKLLKKLFKVRTCCFNLLVLDVPVLCVVSCHRKLQCILFRARCFDPLMHAWYALPWYW